MRRVLLAGALTLVAVSGAAAQRVATGVTLDTIRVGDPFRAVVRIDVRPGTEIALPDSLPPVDDLENAGRVRTRRDSTAAGVRIIAAWPLTAWRPGRLELPSFTAAVRGGERERTITIDLPAIDVVSVLPADTTGIEAKPAKDVVGGNRLWWPWLLLALLVLAALAAAYWWWRRRRARFVALPEPVILPREFALEELRRIKDMELVAQGELKQFYTLVSDVLRRYLEGYDPKWSGDLTTEELAARVREERDVAPAISVLRSSDFVKFARSTPTARDAEADWQKAYDWIGGFRAEPPAVQEAA